MKPNLIVNGEKRSNQYKFRRWPKTGVTKIVKLAKIDIQIPYSRKVCVVKYTNARLYKEGGVGEIKNRESIFLVLMYANMMTSEFYQ